MGIHRMQMQRSRHASELRCRYTILSVLGYSCSSRSFEIPSLFSITQVESPQASRCLNIVNSVLQRSTVTSAEKLHLFITWGDSRGGVLHERPPKRMKRSQPPTFAPISSGDPVEDRMGMFRNKSLYAFFQEH